MMAIKSAKFLCLFIFFFFLTEVEAQSGSATITGNVFLPAKTKKVMRNRGRSYRNRHKRHKLKKKAEAKRIDSPYLDVIIFARPLSFNIDVKPLAKPAIIYQYTAKFYPHVTPVTPGTEVQFINKDKIYHNVFSITPGAKFNIGRRPRGEVVSRKITILGEVKLFCDIHAHMNAFIMSLDTPYFTRCDDKGNYTLENLPQGIYEIHVYNPSYSTWIEKIEIENGQTVKRNFRLSE